MCNVTQTASRKTPASPDFRGRERARLGDTASVAAVSSESAAPIMRVNTKVQYSSRFNLVTQMERDFGAGPEN